MRKTILMITLFILGFGLIGCVIKPYVPDIQQGNIIDQEAISHLKVGMSREEVRELLGDPVLTNIFDRRCWIYAYTNQIKGGKISSKRLITCFDAKGYLATIQK
jgi:outer membrane protein assembly factor BamE